MGHERNVNCLQPLWASERRTGFFPSTVWCPRFSLQHRLFKGIRAGTFPLPKALIGISWGDTKKRNATPLFPLGERKRIYNQQSSKKLAVMKNQEECCRKLSWGRDPSQRFSFLLMTQNWSMEESPTLLSSSSHTCARWIEMQRDPSHHQGNLAMRITHMPGAPLPTWWLSVLVSRMAVFVLWGLIRKSINCFLSALQEKWGKVQFLLHCYYYMDQIEFPYLLRVSYN